MRKIVFLIAGMLLISCQKNNEEPKYSGEIVLSSELLQSGQSYAYYGFTFADGKISIYPPGSSNQPDLAVVYNDFNQEIILQSSNQIDAFYKNGDFQSEAEAEAYFEAYLEVTAEDFLPQAENVKPQQVWTVHTASGKYAKIWVREITIQAGSLTDFANVRIRYQYQPDGSRSFKNSP